MINTLVYEGLGSHLKKHWKKYVLGLGAAGLAAASGAGVLRYRKHRHNLDLTKKEAEIQKIRKHWNTAQNLTNVAAGGLFGHHVNNGFNKVAVASGSSEVSPLHTTLGFSGIAALPLLRNSSRKESLVQRGLNKLVDKVAKTHNQRKIGTHLANLLYAGAKMGTAHKFGKDVNNAFMNNDID